MKKYSLLFSLLLITVLAFSQKAVIIFDKATYDFGTIEEEGGKATYVFTFTNKGISPLVINRVQASCGCTTPTWTKEPVEPGMKGSITVSYNPLGRPGRFTKSITVNSNASDEETVLLIKGDVTGKKTGENNEYPITVGPLRVKARVVNFEQIYKGTTEKRTLKIQNTDKGNLTPTLDGLPPHISASISPSTLKPQEEGTISFTFNTNKTSLWGLNYEDIFLVINGVKKNTADYKLSVASNIIEDFRRLTLEQKRVAPIMEVANKTINLGTLTAGTTKTAKFVLSNKGQNTLQIRRIVNNNQDLWLHQSKAAIGSGKKGVIAADVLTKKLMQGNYKRTITLQTNDPDNTYYILTLTWNIKK